MATALIFLPSGFMAWLAAFVHTIWRSRRALRLTGRAGSLEVLIERADTAHLPCRTARPGSRPASPPAARIAAIPASEAFFEKTGVLYDNAPGRSTGG